MFIVWPSEASFNIFMSFLFSIFPITVTGPAARGLSSVLTGVGPKNMQNAFPGGQKAISPISRTSMPSSRKPSTGIEKYISPRRTQRARSG